MTKLLKPRILVLEDSVDQWQLIDRALNEAYQLTPATTLQDAYKAIESERYDLFLLDVLLPDGQGYDFCSYVRGRAATKDVPIVFLTSKAELEHRLAGFEVGGDDYITKPCTMKELRARIDVKMRRRQAVEQLVFNDLMINFLEQKVIAKTPAGPQQIDLTPREYRLLCFLARNSGAVLSREEIMKSVWGEQMHVSNRSIDTHVAALRRKLGAQARHIKSVHGTGYRFIADTSISNRQHSA